MTEIDLDLARRGDPSEIEHLIAEIERLSRRPSADDVARVLAGLGDEEPWPTNAELGGSATGTRDDEFRSSHMADARRLIALFPTPTIEGAPA